MREDPPDAPPVGAPPSRPYHLVEGAHLRQWLARATVPLAVLCTNGAGLVALDALPRHDAPLALLGAPAGVEIALRAAGCALVLAAAWLRVQAKGVLVRRTTLTTGGVYAHVRHPFYLGVVLGSLGTFLLAGALGAALALAWLLLAAPVYAVTVAGEETGLAALYPAAWAAYAARVPALVPLPGRGAPPTADGVRVTWEGLVREHEPPRLLRFLGGAAAVSGCALPGPPGIVLLGLAAALFGASRLLPGIRPPRRGAA